MILVTGATGLSGSFVIRELQRRGLAVRALVRETSVSAAQALNVDLAIGTRVTSTSGNVQYWKGNGSSDFALAGTFTADGPVLTLAKGDFGGNARQDLVYGFRIDESVFAGGVRILYLDLGGLPPDDVDPAGGSHDYMTPAVTVNNFNYRLNPTTAGAQLMDLAAATKTSATTGALLVFIR